MSDDAWHRCTGIGGGFVDVCLIHVYSVMPEPLLLNISVNVFSQNNGYNCQCLHCHVMHLLLMLRYTVSQHFTKLLHTMSKLTWSLSDLDCVKLQLQSLTNLAL